MKPRPRKLKLLIIDDELLRSYHGYQIPESIEVLRLNKDLPGIDSWRAALQFWTSFNYGEIPDLVLADVRFIEDRTSPLSMLFKQNENYIPTGLLHVKAFAALSRALGKPLGVCTRTIDTALWREQIMSSRPENRAMGYLAMHEIGELAAILGDGKEILGDTDEKQQHITNCYKWLKKNSATEFEQGVRNAIQAYRHSLFSLLTKLETPSIFVRPSHYAELMGWCERMKEKPFPLDSEHDIGLELTYHNGRRDVVSLASVFADYDKITSKALDPWAFTSDERGVQEPWKRDDDARPRIGIYLGGLGSLNEACDAAAKAIDVGYGYPQAENFKPLTLAETKKSYGYSDLTIGIMVLFQFVCIEQTRVGQWEYQIEHYGWKPRSLHFVPRPSRASEGNLRHWLQKLIDVIRKYCSEESVTSFTREELFDQFSAEWVKIDTDEDEENAEWVKWHFERLVSAQVLDMKVDDDSQDYYTLNQPWYKNRSLIDPLLAPHRLPKTVSKLTREERPQREPNRIQQLRMSLGYQKDDFNSLERVLADAFGGPGIGKSDAERVRVGRGILNNFEPPNLPFFLLDLCREYALNHRNWPRDKWPMWMRQGADPASH